MCELLGTRSAELKVGSGGALGFVEARGSIVTSIGAKEGLSLAIISDRLVVRSVTFSTEIRNVGWWGEASCGRKVKGTFDGLKN